MDPWHPGGDLAELPGSRSSPVEARIPHLGSHGKPVANKSARVPGRREAPGGRIGRRHRGAEPASRRRTALAFRYLLGAEAILAMSR